MARRDSQIICHRLQLTNSVRVPRQPVSNPRIPLSASIGREWLGRLIFAREQASEERPVSGDRESIGNSLRKQFDLNPAFEKIVRELIADESGPTILQCDAIAVGEQPGGAIAEPHEPSLSRRSHVI